MIYYVAHYVAYYVVYYVAYHSMNYTTYSVDRGIICYIIISYAIVLYTLNMRRIERYIALEFLS